MTENVPQPRAHRTAVVATVTALALLVAILLAGGSFFAAPGFVMAMLAMATLALLPVLLIVGLVLFVLRPVLDRRQEVVRVRCPQCEALNPEDARFCTACGKPA